MRVLVLTVAAILLGLWTLTAFGLAELAGAAGSLAAVNADLLPLPPEWVVLASDLFALAGAFAPTLVWIVWGVGAVLIAAIAGVGLLLTGRRRPPPGPLPRAVFDRRR